MTQRKKDRIERTNALLHAYGKRTPKEQIAWLDSKGYTAKKERARLNRTIKRPAVDLTESFLPAEF